jgi:hypothetical protein
MTPIPLDQWVNDNNPPAHLEYGKGWWDYIEILRRIAWKFNVDHIDVVGTYVVNTPPPEEELEMPVVRLRTPTVELFVKYDFGAFPEEWTVSARMSQTHPRSTFGLFDSSRRLDTLAGFDPSWVYPPYAESPGRFSCELEDEWDLVMFMGLVVGEEQGPRKRTS